MELETVQFSNKSPQCHFVVGIVLACIKTMIPVLLVVNEYNCKVVCLNNIANVVSTNPAQMHETDINMFVKFWEYLHVEIYNCS